MNFKGLPRGTRYALAHPAPHGARHQQALGLALSLVGNGASPDETFATLRGCYDHTMPDAELREIVQWALGKHPESSLRNPGRYLNSPAMPPRTRPVPVTVESATAAAERFLKGFRCGAVDLVRVSPWKPLDDPAYDTLPLLAGLFLRDEFVNVCTRHGVGITKKRHEWMKHIRAHGVPTGRKGCYFRPNPVSGTPTGPKGGWCDADITACRFALLESDILPLDLQLALLARLPLPVVAIVFSGNRSYHALVRADAPDATAYRIDVKRMLELLRPLGFDQANCNPSRMSRLPGVLNGDHFQKLVYLNPDAIEAVPILGGTK